MFSKCTVIFLLAWLCVASASFTDDCESESKLRPYKDAVMADKGLREASAADRLDAAEFLLGPLDFRHESADRTVAYVKELLGEGDTGERGLFEEGSDDYARLLILRIVLEKDWEMAGVYIDKLIECDPNNGLAWVFRAEAEFQDGLHVECIRSSHRAMACPEMSFHDRSANGRALRMLRKRGMVTKDLLASYVIHLHLGVIEQIVMRQVQFLHFVDILQNCYGGPEILNEYCDMDARTAIFMPREYLSRLFCDMPVKEIYRLNVLHQHLVSRSQWLGEIGRALYGKEAAIFEVTAREIELMKKHGYCHWEGRDLVLKLCENGSVGELEAFMMEPEKWWRSQPDYYPDCGRESYTKEWESFWQDAYTLLDKAKPPVEDKAPTGPRRPRLGEQFPNSPFAR